jgi:hypothetical protein
MTPAGGELLRKAVKLLNSELFRDLGMTDAEARLLIGLLMKMRRSWGDIDGCESWAAFAADAADAAASADPASNG